MESARPLVARLTAPAPRQSAGPARSRAPICSQRTCASARRNGSRTFLRRRRPQSTRGLINCVRHHRHRRADRPSFPANRNPDLLGRSHHRQPDRFTPTASRPIVTPAPPELSSILASRSTPPPPVKPSACSNAATSPVRNHQPERRHETLRQQHLRRRGGATSGDNAVIGTVT